MNSAVIESYRHALGNADTEFATSDNRGQPGSCGSGRGVIGEEAGKRNLVV